MLTAVAPADVLVVLDSTVLIDYLRGRPAVSRVETLLRRGDDVATTAINVEEIARGLRPAEEDAATRLFDGLVVLSVDRGAGSLAGRWRREYAHRGLTLWQADCLVAACAARADGALATGNPKDFPMQGVVVEHWPVGR